MKRVVFSTLAVVVVLGFAFAMSASPAMADTLDLSITLAARPICADRVFPVPLGRIPSFIPDRSAMARARLTSRLIQVLKDLGLMI